MKQLISIVVFVIGIAVGSVEAVACTCDLPPPHKSQRQLITSARNSSQAVFSGVVLKTDEVGISLVRVTFKVDAFWKGPLPSDVIVTTGSGRGDCGYQFTMGHRYLVYAYGSDVTDLNTNICQRTALYKYAAADLKVLGKAKRPSREARSTLVTKPNKSGRERRERVSQLAWCGEGCFGSRRCVNSNVRRLT